MRTYLLIIAFILSACMSNKSSNEAFNNTRNIITKIATDSSELVLETFVDSNKVYNCVLIRQELIFKKNGQTVARCLFPMVDNSKKYTHEDSITMLDNLIYEIGVLEGTNGNIYTIYGAGSCNACPELFAFYSQSGDVLWLSYSNKEKVYKSVGDFYNVTKKYGLDTIKWYKKEYKTATIDL